MHEILNGSMRINLDNCIPLSLGEHSTRGNWLKLQKFLPSWILENIFCAVRTVNLWNALPDGFVESIAIYNFVNKLKCAELVNFLKRHAHK